MKYTADMKGHYDWHVDIGRQINASRKLGFTLQLSHGHDYVGGDPEFHNVPFEKEKVRQKGAIAIFPGFWLHRVTPVTMAHVLPRSAGSTGRATVSGRLERATI